MKVRLGQIFIWTLPVILTAGLFHNCSRVELKKTPEDKSVNSEAPKTLFSSHVCPAAKFGPNDSTKYVFVIDLSASNFGDFEERVDGWYFAPRLGTDFAGQRFTAIDRFIQSCGAAMSGEQFAVVGFSSAAGTLQPTGLSCQTTKFVTGSVAREELARLRARQDADYRSAYQKFENNAFQPPIPDSIVYKATSYPKATSCLERVVANDLLSPNNRADRYHVFFISDGKPQDEAGKGCEDQIRFPSQAQRDECYFQNSLEPLIAIRTAAVSRGKDLRLQGVFYGPNPNVPYVLGELSKQGGTEAVRLVNFGDSDALCRLVGTQTGISYRPDVYAAINLTARYREGRLVIDSDMDGLGDDDEDRLGYDPRNPRSRVPGVLDGVCESAGGITACRQRVQETQCQATQFQGLDLLSDCDLQILKIKPLIPDFDPGVDFDRDGIPDFAEVVLGSDPKVADLSGDTDGDGRGNRAELIAGTDPYFAETTVLDRALNDFSVDPNSPSTVPNDCRAGDWTLQSRRTIVGSTLPVDAGPSRLRHAASAQKIMVIYRSTPVNSLAPKLEYFVKFVDLNRSAITNDYISSPAVVRPTDFESMGEVSP
jgi:hypothetical protein